MSMRPRLRVVVGVVALLLALGTAVLARGTADAADGFRGRQAVWQRGMDPTPASPPGVATSIGETLLGIHARSDVLRAYQSYRAGLANVIPGTTYPQTQARFDAVARLQHLRPSLRNASDRASADVVLGVILADGASSAGQQRGSQLALALAAFARAAREDPTKDAAKLDLEVLLRATARTSKQNPRPTGTPGQRRQGDENPRNPTAPAQAEGNGF